MDYEDYTDYKGLITALIDWKNEQLTLTDVVKSLPNKEKLNFEDWLEFKKIDKLSDGAYRREGSLYTEYYVKSSYETYLK